MDYDFQNQLCTFCYPNQTSEVGKLTPHLYVQGTGWVGGYSPEKGDEYLKIREEYEKGRRKLCWVADSEYGLYVCVKHLLEIAECLRKEGATA